jgi:hypothetical protein
MITKYNFCSCAFLYTLFNINILIVILAYVFINISYYEVRESNNIIRNWNQTIILDIILVRDKCPYKYEALQLGWTPRVLEGIDGGTQGRSYKYTKNFDNFWDIYLDGQKPNSWKPPYEVKIMEIQRKPIYSWRNSIICILRPNSKEKYNNIYSVQPYENCQVGFKKCPHPLDSLNQFMCVRHLWDCGINYLKIIGKNDPYDINKFTKLDFYDGVKSLIFARNVQGLPVISEFKIVKGNFCASPLETSLNKFTSFKLYETFDYANECQTFIYGENYNPYFKLLDTNNEISVLKNMKINSDYETLPVYPKQFLLDYDYNLYYSTYIGLQNYCKKYNFYPINDFMSKSNLDYGHIDGISAIIGMSITLIIFVLLACFCYVCHSSSEKRACQNVCFFIFFLLLLGIVIVAWVYFADYNSVASYKYLFENYVKDPGLVCFDSFHSNLLTYLNEKLEYYPNFYLIIALGGTFMCSFFILIPCLLAYLKKYFNWDSTED